MASLSPTRRKTSPALRFIWWVGTLTLLAVGLAVAYKLFEPQIWRLAMVPRTVFADSPVDERPDYSRPSHAAWIALPGLSPNPTLESPPGFRAAPKPPVDVFFIAPTTYLQNKRWNAPLNDSEANRLLDQTARHMASAFNSIGAVYMPRYRQATFGAFLADGSPDAQKALDLAYGDVLAAFDAFQAARGVGTGPQRPLILASHSQGSLHALRLMKDRFQTPALQQSLIAAYVVGWPVSVEADLAPLGLKPCQTPQATSCVLSWQSFGTGGDTKPITALFQSSASFSGVPRHGTTLLCTNPLTGWISGTDGAQASNLGALPYAKTGKPLLMLKSGVTGAACSPEGFLMLAPNPGAPFAERKMPGENYHAYDYTLFWANVRANAEARVSAFFTPQ